MKDEWMTLEETSSLMMTGIYQNMVKASHLSMPRQVTSEDG
jgi:hypothetical protein